MTDSNTQTVASTHEAPRQIGVEAEVLDSERTIRERLRLPMSTLRRLAVLCLVYISILAILALVFHAGDRRLSIIPIVILLAFILESTDSAAGMGFGTGLAPLLFVLGYNPLQVVPVLLLSETITGLVAGIVHHEVRNVRFSIRPFNEESKLLFLLASTGTIALTVSIGLAYFVLMLPDAVIKAYVGLLVFLMGLIGISRAHLQTRLEYRPRRLVAFALLAGINKGIGGGGYGPVITLGQILS